MNGNKKSPDLLLKSYIVRRTIRKALILQFFPKRLQQVIKSNCILKNIRHKNLNNKLKKSFKLALKNHY